MILNFKVKNQTIELIGNNKIVADSVNYLKCEFEFSDDWGNPKHAIFYGEKTKTAVLITAGDDGKYYCDVPPKFIKYPYFEISVYCVTNNGLITTNMLLIDVEKSVTVKRKCTIIGKQKCTIL